MGVVVLAEKDWRGVSGLKLQCIAITIFSDGFLVIVVITDNSCSVIRHH